jgi:hypothetical protein
VQVRRTLERRLARILPVAVVAMAACSTPSQIVYSGSNQYYERVGTLAVTPDEAIAIAGRPFGGNGPVAVVGRDYLFSEPQKVSCVLLEGTYVNGDTGEVSYRSTEAQLCGGWATSIVGYPVARPTAIPEGAFEPAEHP